MQELAWWIWALLVYSLGLLAAIDALWQGRTAQGTIAWMLGLILMPMITLPLYAFFGSRRFHGYVPAHPHHNEKLDLIADQAQAEPEPHAPPSGQLTYPLHPLFRMPQTAVNHCQL